MKLFQLPVKLGGSWPGEFFVASCFTCENNFLGLVLTKPDLRKIGCKY